MTVSNNLTPHQIFYQRYPNAQGAPAPQPPPPDPIPPWVRRHKGMLWLLFWLGWLLYGQGTIIWALVPFMVGYVWYRERTLNIVTICAAYLGLWLYIVLGQFGHQWPENVRTVLLWGALFSLYILGSRFGWARILMWGYYGRRGRW